jgi:hypothetical protein
MTDNMITTVHGDGETAPAGEPAPPLSAEYIAIVERALLDSDENSERLD